MIWPKVMAFSLPSISDDGIWRSSMIPHKPYPNQKLSNTMLQVFESIRAMRAEYVQLIPRTVVINSVQVDRLTLLVKELGGVVCGVNLSRRLMA